MRTDRKNCSFQIRGKNSRKGGDFHGLSKKEKSSKPAWLLDFSMAERMGFEPMCACAQTDFETLFRRSDVVSLHCPLTDETRGIVNAEVLGWMKPTALLINTARGAVVEENALAEALNTGVIAGAGLDVMTDEPPKPDCPLLHAKNCIITPHIAWASRDARLRLVRIVAENLAAFLAGRPQNTV